MTMTTSDAERRAEYEVSVYNDCVRDMRFAGEHARQRLTRMAELIRIRGTPEQAREAVDVLEPIMRDVMGLRPGM